MACSTSTVPRIGLPETGLVLLDLRSGAQLATINIGSDPVAVAIAGDFAYVADSSPGDVYAVRLSTRRTAWRTHVGGAPFGLLVYRNRVYVSLFDDAAVVALDPGDGRLIARDETLTDPAGLAIDASGQVVAATGDAFGIALIGSTLWTADYKRSTLVPGGDGVQIPLPLAVHPFWLSRGDAGTLLIAAEGASEDTDPGAVLSYDPVTSVFTTLARPRDPDQVIASGDAVFVAAHGDREVLRIAGGTTAAWARGAAAVAIAAEPLLNLLVVGVNAHE